MSFNNHKNNNNNNNNKVYVEVQGWQNATKDDLLSFLSRKARIAIRDAEVMGPVIRGYVYSQKDADHLKAFNGIRFAKDTLKIEIVPTSSGNKGSTVALLRNVLRKRYMEPSKMLDLTNLFNDPDIVNIGFGQGTQNKIFMALMTILSDEPYVKQIESLNLSENNISESSLLTMISQTIPNLRNLSLNMNNISNIKTLETFKYKFARLRELHLAGNPLTNVNGYQFELMKIFPRLVNLDGQIVRDEKKLEGISRFPAPQKQFFFENDQLQELSASFISNFLSSWDSNRQQLIQLYTPDSQFSMSVDVGGAHKEQENNANTSSWGYYLTNSRNLTKVTTQQVRQNKLALGQEKIFELFEKIPHTKHSIATNPEKYSSDCWTINNNSFMIVLHGEYEEIAQPNNFKKPMLPKGPKKYGHGYNNSNSSNSTYNTVLTQRSFDRTWLLVSAGSQYIVASDMLVVRPYAGYGAWNPNAFVPGVPGAVSGLGAAPAAPNVAPSVAGPVASAPVQIPPEIAASLSPLQQETLVRVIMATKLNINYAGMLLESSGWNYENALQMFETSRGNLPADAYV